MIRHGAARPGWLDMRELERDKHGRIKMGVADPDCDDAKTNISQSSDQSRNIN